jgi:hypothetical protein
MPASTSRTTPITRNPKQEASSNHRNASKATVSGLLAIEAAIPAAPMMQ